MGDIPQKPNENSENKKAFEEWFNIIFKISQITTTDNYLNSSQNLLEDELEVNNEIDINCDGQSKSQNYTYNNKNININNTSDENYLHHNLNSISLIEELFKAFLVIFKDVNSENKITGKSKRLEKEVDDYFKELKKFCKIYNYKVPQIFRPDGIRKKIKTHFFKWIKNELEIKLRKIPGYEKNKFERLNQKLINKINIEFNHDLMIKNVFQIYTEDSKENKKLIENLTIHSYFNNIEEDLLFLKSTLFYLYGDYLNSAQFITDYENLEKEYIDLKKQENNPKLKKFYDSYLKTYKKFSEIFAIYFMTTKPNKRTCSTNRRPIKSKNNESCKKFKTIRQKRKFQISSKKIFRRRK